MSTSEAARPRRWVRGTSNTPQQRALEAQRTIVVGVNQFEQDEEPPRLDRPDYTRLAARQAECVAATRASRDATQCEHALDALETTARGSGSLMAPIIDAVRVRATLGEICDRLRAVWGTYRPAA